VTAAHLYDDGGGGERRGVLAAGSIIVDVGKVIDHYPPLDRLAMIESVSLSTGGPGLNLAMDLARLGADYPVEVVGAVGDDDHAVFVLAECARAGVETRRVRRLPGVATSFTDAKVERLGGRRTFFHHAGANARFDPADVDVAASRARILHCGAPGIHALADTATGSQTGAPSSAPNGAPKGGNGWSQLLARARAAGLHTNLELVTLDAARVRELALPCLPHLDSIVVNELEAGAVTGIETEAPSIDGPVDWTTLEATAARLVELGVHRLAVVHFPAGCVAADGAGNLWRQGSVHVPQQDVVSTTGAGDAFAAGVIHGLHEHLPVADCLKLGAAAAAACVRSAGTSDGIRPVAECLTLAAATGFRPTTPGDHARRPCL
jgi:sugar/nucleoside kinase (ribokinase family)